MIICPHCHHEEYEGEFFCSECGARLGDAKPNIPVTVHLASQQIKDTQDASSIAETGPTAALYIPPGQIALMLVPGQPPVILSGRTEYVLGRQAQDQTPPDVNLVPYGGRDKGVSRRHASLRVDRQQLLLMDLGSANGTQLNGTPVKANHPARLENGDEIRLGKLALRIYFNL